MEPANEEKAQLKHNIKVIDDIMIQIMKEHGFQKKKRNWYFENEEVTLVVNLQQSSWGKQFYINMGVVIKALENLKQPPEYKCHFSTRPEQVTRDIERGVLNAENTAIPDEERQRAIREIMLHAVLPRLDKWKTLKGLTEDYLQGRIASKGLLLWQARDFLEDEAKRMQNG